MTAPLPALAGVGRPSEVLQLRFRTETAPRMRWSIVPGWADGTPLVAYWTPRQQPGGPAHLETGIIPA